jgi:hypothetical protein
MSTSPDTSNTEPITHTTVPAEGSILGRVVALLTPVFTAAAGWLAGLVAKAVPGAHLDNAQIATFMTATAAAALAAAYKWLTGWHHHEQRVSDGTAPAVRAAKSTKPAPRRNARLGN